MNAVVNNLVYCPDFNGQSEQISGLRDFFFFLVFFNKCMIIKCCFTLFGSENTQQTWPREHILHVSWFITFERFKDQQQVFKSILWLTGTHCSYLKAGVIWSSFLVFVRTLAAVFWINFGYLIVLGFFFFRLLKTPLQ